MLQVVPVQSSGQRQIPFCKIPLFSHTRLGSIIVVFGAAVVVDLWVLVWSVEVSVEERNVEELSDGELSVEEPSVEESTVESSTFEQPSVEQPSDALLIIVVLII